jgi:hypothetical protein
MKIQKKIIQISKCKDIISQPRRIKNAESEQFTCQSENVNKVLVNQTFKEIMNSLYF